MTKELLFESLHNHTSDSDGSQTHLEVLGSAERHGIGAIAFTEHDSLPSAKTLRQLRDYNGPLKWLVGIELTSKLPKQNERAGSFHILGLFTDPTNKALLDHCRDMAEGRINRMKHFVKQLNSIGLKITEDDCLREAAGGPIGSPHMVKALAAYPENQKIVDQLAAKMRQAAEHDQVMAHKYQIMLKQDPEQYPYALFMKHSSFIPMPPADEGAMLDLDSSVGLIRASGGIAIIAHWFFNKEVIKAGELEDLIKHDRFDGIETDVANLVSNKDHLLDDPKWLAELVKRYNVIETVGADSHSERDLEFFSKSKLAQKSIGMTEDIIKRVKPSLEWTNLA